jgi:hypothetical protein
MTKIKFLHKFLMAHCLALLIVFLFFHYVFKGGEVEYAQYYIFLRSVEADYPFKDHGTDLNFFFLPSNRKRNIFFYPAPDYREYSALRVSTLDTNNGYTWILLNGLDNSDSNVIMTEKSKSLLVNCDQISRLSLNIIIHKPTLDFLKNQCHSP